MILIIKIIPSINLYRFPLNPSVGPPKAKKENAVKPGQKKVKDDCIIVLQIIVVKL